MNLASVDSGRGPSFARGYGGQAAHAPLFLPGEACFTWFLVFGFWFLELIPFGIWSLKLEA
jgi:hypothetical protein